MGLYLAIKSNEPGDTWLVLVNGTTDTGYRWLADGFHDGILGQVVQNALMSSSIDQSPVKTGQSEDSRNVPLRISIEGDTRTDYTSKRDALVNAVSRCNNHGGRLRVRAVNGEQCFELDIQHVNSGPWDSQSAQIANYHEQDLQFVCSPYMYGDCMDGFDEFELDPFSTNGKYNSGGSDWELVSGDSLTWNGAGLGITAAAGNDESVLVHTGSPYDYGDNFSAVNFAFDSQASGNKIALIVRYLDSDSYIQAVVDDNGTNSRIGFEKVVSGVVTALTVYNNLPSRVPAGGSNYFAAYMEGNKITACYAEGGTTRNIALVTDYDDYSPTTLAGGDATTYGAGIEGKTGIAVTPISDVTVYDWQRYAFCYAGQTSNGAMSSTNSPVGIDSYGTIPGNTEAEVRLKYSGDSFLNKWLFFAWQPYVEPYSSRSRLFGIVGNGLHKTSYTSTAYTDAAGGYVDVITANTVEHYIDYDPQTVDYMGADKIAYIRVCMALYLHSSLTSLDIAIRCETDTNTTIYSLEQPNGDAVDFSSLIPSSGSAIRLVDLGTIPILIQDEIAGIPKIYISFNGQANYYGYDYIFLFPSNQYASHAIGVEASNYTTPLVLSTAAFFESKFDLSAYRSGYLDAHERRITRLPSLIGNKQLVKQGSRPSWLVIPACAPLGDPLASDTSAFSKSAKTVQFSVTPRYWIGL